MEPHITKGGFRFPEDAKGMLTHDFSSFMNRMVTVSRMAKDASQRIFSMLNGFERIRDTMVLCGANAYEQKYYFNEDFSGLPESVKQELQIMCVWFVQEIGGILTLEYLEDGALEFKTAAHEYDGSIDEIGSVLKIKQFQNERRELLESLELYYKVFYLGEDLPGEAEAAEES